MIDSPGVMALHIGVVGEGVCSAGVARDAERVGAAIARAGAVLLVLLERFPKTEYLVFFGQL